ncbi:MAG: STAS domain-containing protein [Candidatus Krumholzibacteriia bacterium]
MTPAPILVIRPVTTLGVSQLLVLERAADGAETEVLRRPGTDHAAVTAEIARRADFSLPGLVVDLGSCDWVDSGVLGVWVSWHHLLARRGGQVVVCRANERISNILRISQLDSLFPNAGSLEAAVAALSPAAE